MDEAHFTGHKGAGGPLVDTSATTWPSSTSAEARGLDPMSHIVGKAAAVAVPVAVSTIVTCLVGAVLPLPAGAAVFWAGLGCAILLATGRAEGPAVRALLGARAPTPVELATLARALTLLCQHAMGPPLTQVWVAPGTRQVGAKGAGRRTVIVSAGLVRAIQDGHLPARQAAAVIAQAAALVRAGCTRSDLLICLWTLPWQLLHSLTHALARTVGQIPLTSLAWRLRFLVFAIAVAQTTREGHPGIAVLTLAIGALTWAAPRWEQAWRAEDEHRRDLTSRSGSGYRASSSRGTSLSATARAACGAAGAPSAAGTATSAGEPSTATAYMPAPYMSQTHTTTS